MASGFPTFITTIGQEPTLSENEPTLIENSPRTSVQTHIPQERFILLMAERISRTLFCCTSIVNRRHAGLEGGSSVERSCRKTAVMSHAPFRRWGWADTGSHPALVQGSRMGRLV